MKAEWEMMVFDGLSAKDGSEYTISVSKPFRENDGYACKVIIPGVVDRLIYHETSLSALSASLSLVEKLVYEPAEALMVETTLTEDDFPDLEVSVVINQQA